MYESSCSIWYMVYGLLYVLFLIFFVIEEPDITDYFPSLGTGVGYYLYVYDASNLTKYVKYYITGISDVASSVVSNPNAPPATITIPASKKITVRINPSAVSGDFKADLDTSQSPAVPRKVLVSIMADATEIDTRLANSETRLTTLESDSGLSPTSTTIFEDVIYVDEQEAFNALTAGKIYIDMRKLYVTADQISGFNVNTTINVPYSSRTMGCSFTVSGTTSKTPVLSSSYANLPNTITITGNGKNITMVKSSAGTGWSPVPSMLKSVYPKTKVVYGFINHTSTKNCGPEWYAITNTGTGWYYRLYFPNILTGQSFGPTDFSIQITTYYFGIGGWATLANQPLIYNANSPPKSTEKYIEVGVQGNQGVSFFFTFVFFK